MNETLRRLRGGVGTALTWGVLWTIPGAVIGGTINLLVGAGTVRATFESAALLGMVSGGAGVVAGAVFSALLATVYRKRRLEDLGPGIMAAWGAGTALSVPALLAVDGTILGDPAQSSGLIVIAIYVGVAGALSAGGMVKIAQGAPDSSARIAGPDSLDDQLSP